MDDVQPVTSAWPDGAMSFFLSGYTQGISTGRKQLDTEIAALHTIAYRNIQGAARTRPHPMHQAAVKAREIASCERQKTEAVPWPDEVNP